MAAAKNKEFQVPRVEAPRDEEDPRFIKSFTVDQQDQYVKVINGFIIFWNYWNFHDFERIGITE